MQTNEITVPNYSMEKMDLSKKAGAIMVTDAASYEVAAEFLKAVKGLAKKVDETFDPIIKKQHEAHKEAITQKKRHAEPLEKIEKLVKDKMTTWWKENERLRAIEQAKLEAAEKKRLEDEALNMAGSLEAQGENEEANNVLQNAIDTRPVVESTIEQPKVAGVSMRKVLKYRIIDATAVKRDFLIPDDKAITKIVQGMGVKAEALVGGIQVYEDVITSSRSE